MAALIITLYCVSHLPLSSFFFLIIYTETHFFSTTFPLVFHFYLLFLPISSLSIPELDFYTDKDNLKIPQACFVTANRVPPNSAVHKTLELRVLHKGQFSSSSQLLFLCSVCCCLTVKQSAIDNTSVTCSRVKGISSPFFSKMLPPQACLLIVKTVKGSKSGLRPCQKLVPSQTLKGFSHSNKCHWISSLEPQTISWTYSASLADLKCMHILKQYGRTKKVKL